MVAATAFVALVGAAGFRAAPGALFVPLHEEFGWSTTRYYQVLDAALETPEALHHDPMLVRRLQKKIAIIR